MSEGDLPTSDQLNTCDTAKRLNIGMWVKLLLQGARINCRNPVANAPLFLDMPRHAKEAATFTIVPCLKIAVLPASSALINSLAGRRGSLEWGGG